MTVQGNGAASGHVLNWFRLENYDELRFEYHVFDVRPLPQAKLDGFQKMKRLAEGMRYTRGQQRTGWMDAVVDGRPVLLAPATSRVDDRYTCEIGDSSKVVHELVRRPETWVLPPITPATRATVAKILRETIRVGLGDQYQSLWRDGDRYYILSSAEERRGYRLYRGFSYHIECRPGGEVYAVVDSVARFLDSKSLQERYDESGRFEELKELCATKPSGEVQVRFAVKRRTWFSTKFLAEVRSETCSQFPIVNREGRRTTVWEEHQSVGFARPGDFVVGMKSYADGETEYYPASLVKQILWSDDITDEENPSVLAPPARLAAIQTALGSLSAVRAGGGTLKLSHEPLVSGDCVVLDPPNLEFKAGKKLTLQWDQPSSKFSKNDAIKRFGPFATSGLRQPYLIVPETITTEQTQALKADLEAVASSYGEELDFRPFPYTDALMAARQVAADSSSADRGCIIVLRRLNGPDYPVFKKAITRTPTQCAVASTVLPPPGCSRADVVAAAEGRAVPKAVRGYANRLALVVLGLIAKAGGKPWVLGEPLSYYPALGVDIGGRDSRFASFTGIFDPFGRLLRIGDSVPHRREELTEEDLAGTVLNFLTDYKEFRPDFVAPALVLYRDGELKGEEPESLRLAADRARDRGLLRQDAPVAIVEVRKTNPYRIFDRRLQGLSNPYPGCWFRLSDDSAILATTGTPWIADGSVEPLLIRVETVDGNLELERVVRDVFLMSELNISTPTLPHKLPVVIALADRRAAEVSEGISSPGPSF
jgi:hypothetical protein